MSAEACPAKMVTFPGATAVMIGGSSVESVAIVMSLEDHDNPVAGWEFESSACSDRVSPTTMLIISGARLTEALDPDPPEVTLNAVALLQTLFCCTLATPLTALLATVA